MRQTIISLFHSVFRCCNLRSSGLSIECQSCVHIAYPDQWVQIEPSVCTDEGVSKFRVSTRPGRYECVRTRIRWVCDCDVTLQYQTVDGQFLNAELERLQCNRIAPVMDVTVISGKLEQVHLPHYICLGESEASLRDAVKVLSIKDEGITVEPVQLTRFHAKIIQPSFSIKTLIINWIMGWDEHCDLLLYMRSKAPLILHVYLFPIDDGGKEKVKKIEKSSYSILHPRPDRPFRMKTPHILDVPGASVHPKEGITLRRETDPNFFKIKTRLENFHLIQRVKNIQIIADKLLQQQLIHEEQYSEIKESSTSQDGMRNICGIVRKHSDAVKAKLISILQEEKLYHF